MLVSLIENTLKDKCLRCVLFKYLESILFANIIDSCFFRLSKTMCLLVVTFPYSFPIQSCLKTINEDQLASL